MTDYRQDAGCESKPVILSLENLGKQFERSKVPAVRSVTFTLDEGEILALLGPSGCGKTTLLRLIAGFETPQRGTIAIAGTVVAGEGGWIPPERRGVGMVFQDYALFPHLTVAQNLAFGLEEGTGWGKGIAKKNLQERVSEVLCLVGLAELGNRYPHQISGGQQQRVALARALAPRPALVLLDEPLSNLDIQVRVRLRQELRRIIKAAGASAIFVTHDREEALSIADRVAVMQRGEVQQLGSPTAIYWQPATRFVAEFVAQANFIPAQFVGESWQTPLGDFILPQSLSENEGYLMIRQEDLTIVADPEGKGIITDRQFLGREYSYTIEIPYSKELPPTSRGLELVARSGLFKHLEVGTQVRIKVDPQAVQLFPKDYSPLLNYGV